MSARRVDAVRPCWQIGRLPPSFGDASKLAAAVLDCGYEYASGKIFYNQFKSVVSYQQSDLPVFSRKAVEVCSQHILRMHVDIWIARQFSITEGSSAWGFYILYIRIQVLKQLPKPHSKCTLVLFHNVHTYNIKWDPKILQMLNNKWQGSFSNTKSSPYPLLSRIMAHLKSI